MKPATRSRSGQPRNFDGRFTKGGSKVVEARPVQAELQVAAAVQEAEGGNKIVAGGSGRIQQVWAVAEKGADVALDQHESSEGDEVSTHETEGSDSASSDSVNEMEEVLEDSGNQFSDLPNAGGGQLADQLFDQMPQSGPSLPAVKLGAAGTGGVQVGAVGAAQVAPWVNLFRDNRNPAKGIKLDEWEVEGDLVMLEEDDVDVVEEVWGFCLVGLFAGKFPGMAAVRSLREGWKVNCSHWRHRSGWIVFKFQSDEDRLKVLNGGPYFLYGSNLILKTMPRCFRFEGEDVSSVPIWIQLPGLPLDCWNARSLGKIVSKVGKPLTTDKMTLTKERLSFARVLVEVDASSDVVSDVEVRLPTGVVYHQSVIPEFRPKFCKKCKSFGHVEGDCGKGVPKSTSRPGGVDLRPLGGKQMEGVASAVLIDQAVVAPDVGAALGRNVASNGEPAMGRTAVPVGAPSCPEVALGSGGVGEAADALKGKSVLMSGQQAVVAVHQQTATVGLHTDEGGWTTAGKKNKQKKKTGQPGVSALQLGSVGDVELQLVPPPISGRPMETANLQQVVVPSLAASVVLGGQPDVAAVRQQPVEDEGLLVPAEPSPALAKVPAYQQEVVVDGKPSQSGVCEKVSQVPGSFFCRPVPVPRWKGKGRGYGR